MTSDLRTLLLENAPPPRGPVDVDELFARVDRRRRGRHAVGVVAMLAAVAAGAGALQLLADPLPIPVVDQEEPTEQEQPQPDESAESALTTAGAFDRGVDEVLRLDPDTDERLHGRVLTAFDSLADEVAVGDDGAIGFRSDTILVNRGASVDLGPPPDEVTWWGHDAVAFDTDGTLWALHGRTLVGLRRDGTLVEYPDAVTPVPGPLGGVGLRVTGTDVSVVVYDAEGGDEGTAYENFNVPLQGRVVPVVGEDPLAGIVPMEVPSRLPGEPFSGLRYHGGPGVGLTSGGLASSTIVGDGLAELDWQDPPSDEDGHTAFTAQSQVVADTAASLLWTSLYDDSFLVVDRGDGTRVVALVAGGPHPHLSISPDGAVHVAVQDGSGGVVRTLLDADLRPLQGEPIEVAAGPPAFLDRNSEEPTPEQCTDGLGEEDELLLDAEFDVDGDGQDDLLLLLRAPMRSDPDGRLVICLADGTGFGRWAFAGADRLVPADFAGTPGLAAIATSPDEVGDTYEFFPFVDGRPAQFNTFWSAPYDRRWWPEGSASGVEYLLTDRRDPDASVAETFGCRSTDAGSGVEIIELRIQGIDDTATGGDGVVAYTGAGLAVTYVLRQVEPDWGGITEPSTRVQLPAYDGGPARPAEILSELGATWLCRP